MTAKRRTIEIDSDTASLLEAWADERGLTVSQLLTELASGDPAASREWDSMRETGRGPWAPAVLAEDARRLAAFERDGQGVPWSEVKAWMQSWGTPEELPPPKPRTS